MSRSLEESSEDLWNGFFGHSQAILSSQSFRDDSSTSLIEVTLPDSVVADDGEVPKCCRAILSSIDRSAWLNPALPSLPSSFMGHSLSCSALRNIYVEKISRIGLSAYHYCYFIPICCPASTLDDLEVDRHV